MGRMKIAAAVVVAFAAGSLINSQAAFAAYGFCSQPFPPSTYLSKPNKPYCFTSRSCSEWQIKSYNDSVDRYYRDLRQYAEQVDDYYNSATKYVNCMSYLD